MSKPGKSPTAGPSHSGVRSNASSGVTSVNAASGKVTFQCVPSTDGSSSGERPTVVMSLEAACVSPLISAAIQGGGASQAGTSQDSAANELTVTRNGSDYVISLANPACKVGAIKSIGDWCDYHTTDALFEATCRFEEFDEDEYEKEQARLLEQPCYFDWNYICKLGGDGERLNPKNRGQFYDVMIAANYLQLDNLVLLGGKYICRYIAGKSVDQVRSALGILKDIPDEEIKRMEAENRGLFNAG